MKSKLIIGFLFLLLIIGGVVFYIGWIQIEVAEHTYGVVFTKTSGYSDEIIRPGEFAWNPERLIPNNFVFHLFEIKPQRFNIESAGVLPSGDIYSNYLDGQPDFSYKLKLSILYKIIPDYLIDLVEHNGLLPETLDEWYERLNNSIQKDAVSFIHNKSRDPEYMNTISYQLTLIEDDMTSHINNRYPPIDVIEVTPVLIVLPDVDLYYAGKELYLSLLDVKREIKEAAIRESEAAQVSTEVSLSLLREYGKLVTEYPNLLLYFSIFKDKESFTQKTFPSLPTIDVEDFFIDSLSPE